MWQICRGQVLHWHRLTPHVRIMQIPSEVWVLGKWSWCRSFVSEGIPVPGCSDTPCRMMCWQTLLRIILLTKSQNTIKKWRVSTTCLGGAWIAKNFPPRWLLTLRLSETLMPMRRSRRSMVMGWRWSRQKPHHQRSTDPSANKAPAIGL